MSENSTGLSVVCFGEILIRFSTEQNKSLTDTRIMEMFLAGAECNVAINLNYLGHASEMVTTVSNDLFSDYILQQLRRYGVKTAHVFQREGRIGKYFLETVGLYRQANIIYDRENSSFASSQIEDYEWEKILTGAAAYHFSGINLALSKSVAMSAVYGATVAKKYNQLVSFDSNYRSKLWQGKSSEASPQMDLALEQAGLAFLTEQDIALVIKLPEKTSSECEDRKRACHLTFEKYPDLQWIASTFREYDASGSLSYRGSLFARNNSYFSKTYQIPITVDQIGTGDAFAAGILHGILTKMKPQDCVEFATAIATAKHSIHGDLAALTQKQVELVISGEWKGICR